MPYLLPDESIIGNCKIKFEIPTDEKWVSIMVGAISQLAKAENWEEGTGLITVEEATETALAIVESVSFQAC